MKRLIAAATACLLASTAAFAQVPANYPPESFKGRQYVDSAGCAYIRAGVGDMTTWIPRMTRAREPVCGMTPTFGAPVTAKAAPAQTPAPAPVKAPEPAAPKVAAVAPKTTGRTTTKAPIKTIASAPARKAAPAPKPKKVQTVAAPMVVATQTVVAPKTVEPAPRTGVIVCPNASQSSNGYINQGDVRCGPQDLSATSVIGYKKADGTIVYEAPEGYVKVWKDGRLNPQRGPRTETGDAQTDQVWTRDTPRQLVDPALTPSVQVASVAGTPVKAQQIAGNYVQVGTFGVPTNAQRAAQSFAQANYPVRIIATKKGMQVVIVGAPAGGNVQQTLSAARAAGFLDAFVR